MAHPRPATARWKLFAALAATFTLGPLKIGLYLTALPDIAADLHASVAAHRPSRA